jgi:polar amino acid transport system substrate-binding protein
MNPDADLATIPAPFTFEPIGIALPANDALFVNLVQNYLRSLEGTGLLDQLRAKWFDNAGWLMDVSGEVLH